MGSEKMEPFDVLSMGNISDFHLEPSNLNFFPFFKFQNPFISQKKILLITGFMVLKMTGLNPGFLHKNRFRKICTVSLDIKQNVQKIRLFDLETLCMLSEI